jgi:hypothetical protein
MGPLARRLAAWSASGKAFGEVADPERPDRPVGRDRIERPQDKFPLAELAPDWRDPISGLTVRQLLARLRRPRAA